MIKIYDIVIFGCGSASEKLSRSLNENINILCYLDNNRSMWGKKFNNKLVCNPSEIRNIEYDYIVIASQFNNDIFTQLINYKVSQEKILEYINFINNKHNYFEYKMNLFKNDINNYEALVTGISYFVSGINGDILKHRGINFAFDSQDLYYDYHIAKYLFENYNTNIKYTIIGLSYYTFQYDLSLSSMKDNVKLYYPKLKKSHNIQWDTYDYDRILINNIIADKILKKSDDGNYLIDSRIIPLTQKNEDFDLLGKRQAELDCNKNYPITVLENKKIFKEYLSLLYKNNIKPIVVVCPVSKYYSKYFSNRIKDEFLEIMYEVRKEYKFQYIDYFESALFDDSMFYDVSHLTFEAGKKFTQILNDEIEW